MSKGSLYTLLLAAWDEAVNSKDQVEERASQLSSVLALLMECHGQPWFGEAVSDQIKRTYPKQYRCLLDAVLQAFVAASPLHCGPVLHGFMQIPGCITLKSPFRRDLAALFKAPAQLQSCWPSQGVVVCSIVTCLATAASTQLWRLSQQKQSLETQQQLQQEFGTSLSWLVDCLLHALPSQLLSLLQLVLATAVFHANKQEAAQQAVQSHLAMQCSTRGAPPAKRPRFRQPQQQQQEAEAASSVSSAVPSQQAIQLGMQLLTAVCCCEHVQHSSRRLVPYAAAAAASTAVGTTEQAVVAVCHGRWLYRHLCSHVTAVPAGSSTAASTAAASTAAPSTTTITSSSGTRQQPASDAVQPSTALAHVLRQLSDHSPVLVLEFVRLIMGLPQKEVAQSAVAHVSRQPATSAASLTKSDGTSGSISSLFVQQLVQAARQWLPVAEAAPGQSKKQRGKNGFKQQQQQKPTAPQQQVSVQGNVSSSGSSMQGPVLPVKHVLPDTSNVNATWVCKHVVPILVQATHEQWSQQQYQQALELDPSVQLPTAAEALVQLLSAEGMLLPAAGEVLVSARVLAEGLNSLQADLQSVVAQHWRRQQQQAVAGAAAAAGAQQPGCLVAWKVLQPMLCLLSSLEPSSPFAALLVKCVQRCIDSSSATSTTAAHSTSASSARGILQHILLPVRFGLKMQARIWLLQQLLTTQQCSGDLAVHNVAAAAGVTSGAPLAVGSTSVEGISPLLTVLINVLKTDWQKQLAQGLQLLAKQQQQGVPGGRSGVASLQQMELAAALTELLRELDSRHTVVRGAVTLPIEVDWQLQVADQLRIALQAADAAAYDAIMLGHPLETCAQ